MAPSLRQRNVLNSQNIKSEAIKKQSSKKSSLTSCSNKRQDVNIVDLALIYPSSDTAFKALLSARFCAAIWSQISDCDEAFNYWEPSHYLLFGKGLQTWEYSPAYALRSYTYLLVHVVPAWLYNQLLQPNRLLVFYFTRCLLGLCCALCEVFFYRSVCREFGIHVGRIMLAMMLFSAGMFISSTAFLPSSFSMYMTLFSMGAWFHRKYELAVFATALSAFFSWPFAALIGAPIAVDMLMMRGDWVKFLQWSAISCVAILLPMLRIDSLYYGRLVLAPWNIVRYNIMTSHGPDLYGTEPFHFYFVNGFLNFNIVFVAALITPFLLVALNYLIPRRMPSCLPYALSLAPLYLWLAIFCLQPHKEERFLFPVYPLVCLCGAVTVDGLQKLWFRLHVRTTAHYIKSSVGVLCVVLALSSLLAVSRILALYKGYHAPMDIFMELNRLNAEGAIPIDRDINICIGKEWYRYPSSFFLPSNSKRFLLEKGLKYCPNDTLKRRDLEKLVVHSVHSEAAFVNQREEDKGACAEAVRHAMEKPQKANTRDILALGKLWWHLLFLRSEFRGQLPQPYSNADNATMIVPANMNDENREEVLRYVDVSVCDFLVDLDTGGNGSLREPNYARQMHKWNVLKSIPFLDASRSHRLFRAFYVPVLWDQMCTFGSYVLLQPTNSSPSHKIHSSTRVQ